MKKSTLALLVASVLSTAAAGFGCSSAPKHHDVDDMASVPKSLPANPTDSVRTTDSSADLGASSSGRGR